MSLEHDLAGVVNEQSMWYAFYVVLIHYFRLLIAIWEIFPVAVPVTGPVPIFSLNLLLHLIQVVVNADRMDFDSVVPLLILLFQHIFVLLHGALRRWTPICPELDEPNLTIFRILNFILWSVLKSCKIMRILIITLLVFL